MLVGWMEDGGWLWVEKKTRKKEIGLTATFGQVVVCQGRVDAAVSVHEMEFVKSKVAALQLGLVALVY